MINHFIEGTQGMKIFLIAVSALLGSISLSAKAAEGEMHMGNHQHAMSMMDTRISLGVSGPMKQHQLSNMREHVDAIRTIVGLMSENKFEDASKVAHAKLGLTPDMQTMCGMFNNDNFEKLGLAFHKSGDDLGNALLTRDVNASLRALNKTMQYCVECHAAFRQ